MEIRRKASLKQLRGSLLIKNLTIASFAKVYDYNENTVRQAIYKHWGKPTSPRGEKTMEILEKLEGFVEGNLEECMEGGNA